MVLILPGVLDLGVIDWKPIGLNRQRSRVGLYITAVLVAAWAWFGSLKPGFRAYTLWYADRMVVSDRRGSRRRAQGMIAQ